MIRFLVREFVRKASLLCFIWLPYGRVKSIGRPDLRGHVLLAPTHNNFYCDITTAGNEAPNLPGWMAKVGLFTPLFGGFLRFLGARPIVRILDAGKIATPRGEMRRLNESSFDEIVASLRREGVFCIFPEGNSLERPGLGLPLKPGVAQLALRAESAAGFALGLRIVPLGIEYPASRSLGGRVVARYGKEIRVADWEKTFAADPKIAAKEIIAKLTEELLGVYPHFSDYNERRVADLLFFAGKETSRLRISKIFRGGHRFDPSFGELLDQAARPLSRFYLCGRGGAKKFGAYSLVVAPLGFLLLLPLAVFSLIHNSLAAFTLKTAVGKISTAAPDHMTLRAALAIFCVPFFHGCQFLLLSNFFATPSGPSGFPAFFLYSAWGILAWKMNQIWVGFAATLFHFLVRMIPQFASLENSITALERSFDAHAQPRLGPSA